MRLPLIAALVIVLLGCSSPSEGRPRLGDVTPDGLDRVDVYGVFGAFAKPGARWDGYRSVYLETGVLRYRPGVRYPRGRRIPHPAPARSVELSVEDETRLWRYFEEVFGREFRERSRFEVASEPGPNTLSIRAHFLDLVAFETGRSSGAESTFSRHSPAFTLVLDVRDSVTHEPLARIVDRRGTVSSNGLARQVGTSLDSAGVRRQMHDWARVLRTHLDRLSG